jgi:protein-disulfide isomerase
MRNIWLISAALLPLVGGLSGSALALDSTPQGILVAQTGNPELAADDRIMGKPDAPVTIFEYASLTCPHCAFFVKEMLPKIKTEWIDTGKAKLVFRDFPLDGSALKAAMVARCAPPERYYAFIDMLFAQQGSWGIAPDPAPGLARLAKLGGMSDERFQSCLKDDALQTKIVAGRLAGEKEYGVESTPTFLIGGKRIVGAQPYETFDELLKSVSPKE